MQHAAVLMAAVLMLLLPPTGLTVLTELRTNQSLFQQPVWPLGHGLSAAPLADRTGSTDVTTRISGDVR